MLLIHESLNVLLQDVVFGKVLEGMDTIVRIQRTPVDDNYLPFETEIKIADSGVIPTEPLKVKKMPVVVRTKCVVSVMFIGNIQ